MREKTEHRAEELFDWRAHVRESPLTMLGAAFGGGLLIAAIASHRKARSRPSAEPHEGHDAADDEESSASHDAWKTFKRALVGAALTQAAVYVADFLPDFPDHLEDEQDDDEEEDEEEEAPPRKARSRRSA